MEFSVPNVDGPTANRIVDWQYDPPDDFYDIAADPDGLE